MAEAAAPQAFDQPMLRNFQAALSKANHIVILTDHGYPTLQVLEHLQSRAYQPFEVQEGFGEDMNPLSWVVSRSRPNPAHFALAAFERKCEQEGKRLTLITQNIDRLHQAAGSRKVVELHGSLWDVCYATRHGNRAGDKKPWEDRTQPLVKALKGQGAPDVKTHANIPVAKLPHHEGRLLRPGVIWFDELLDDKISSKAETAVKRCDLFLTVGTSSVVYPAAGFASQVASRGVPTAEVNLDTSDATDVCQYVFQGKAGELLPQLLDVKV